MDAHTIDLRVQLLSFAINVLAIELRVQIEHVTKERLLAFILIGTVIDAVCTVGDTEVHF